MSMHERWGPQHCAISDSSSAHSKPVKLAGDAVFCCYNATVTWLKESMKSGQNNKKISNVPRQGGYEVKVIYGIF